MYERYKILRDERGLTDSEVSRATGIPPSTISTWKHREDGKMKFDTICKLASFFGVSLDYFRG